MSDQIPKETENTTKNFIKEDIRIEQLRPYKNNPFSIPTGKVFHEMITSIGEEGILQEILARFTEDKDSSGNPIYEIISGHTRVEAAKKAGLAVVPVKVVDMNDDEAAIKVVESNFMRTTSTPSELGKAFKLRLDAMNHQGERTDLTSGQNKHKSSRDAIAVIFKISSSRVQRLIRLTKLIPEFQKKVDEKEITLSIATNISHLSEKEQSVLNTILNQGKIKLTKQQSIALKKRKEAIKEQSVYNLTKDNISNILKAETKSELPGQGALVNEKIIFKSISEHKHFKDKKLSNEDMLKLIMKALDSYDE